MNERWTKRLLVGINVLGALLLCGRLALGQEVALDVKGDNVRVVKIVDKYPFTVMAPAGGVLYRWTHPEGMGVIAERRGNNLLVTFGPPSGALVFSVEYGVIDFKAQTFSEHFGKITVAVGEAPAPKPPVPPEPKPDPIPVGALRVIFVRESADKMTTDQDHAWNSTKIAAYLNEKCVKDGTQAGWRKWDRDTNKVAETAAMKQLFEDSKAQLASLPAVIVAVGQKATVYPVVGEEETLAILKKHAEGK